ncbi:MAG: hypothetical protein H6830_00645 [Planctomycetes bacterium]|nr:hypothetical protein [Planctomycetota bacterium]MCB9911017.1 hypothetical protein [Planctomycetota bacterium]HPF13386.1 hypothetical protein [Planctomycetota bacterium]HRV80926.1 hypothetical protein [Planctomycetota bacterium]
MKHQEPTRMANTHISPLGLVGCAAGVATLGAIYFALFVWPRVIEYNGKNPPKDYLLGVPNALLAGTSLWLLVLAKRRNRPGTLRWYHFLAIVWVFFHALMALMLYL